jgi:cobalt-zinc-cadmium efflux system outer membrane protein
LNKVEESLSRSRYEAQLHMARSEIKAAHEKVVRLREAEALYRRSADPDVLVRTALIAYDEGEQGILELLDAYRIALAVELRRLMLAAEVRKARIHLDRVVGEEVIP